MTINFNSNRRASLRERLFSHFALASYLPNSINRVQHGLQDLTSNRARPILPFKIAGTGFYAPRRIETAEDLAPRIGRSAEWIVSHTGVTNRHISDEPVEVMASHAARLALKGTEPDLVINASLSPRQLIPDGAGFILRELGLSGVPGFSVHATCLSFLVALKIGASLLQHGQYRRILIVSAESGSGSRNFKEPESSVLIGDGAAAAVLEPVADGEDRGLLGWNMATYPAGLGLAEIRGGGVNRHPNDPATTAEDNLFHMDGPAIFRLTKRNMLKFRREIYLRSGLKPEDIDLVIPHQPSGPGVAAIGPVIGVRPEKVISIVGEYGNCIAASLPMALAHADASGQLKEGSILMLLGFGAGVSLASAIIRY